MEKSFKAGDAVRLKVGGPIMTIDFKTKEGKHTCKWHDGTSLQVGEFLPEELDLASRKHKF